MYLFPFDKNNSTKTTQVPRLSFHAGFFLKDALGNLDI